MNTSKDSGNERAAFEQEALEQALAMVDPRPYCPGAYTEHVWFRRGWKAARAASTATAMLDVLHDSNRENDRAWSAENRVARAAAPQADEAVTGEKKP